jgi:hypothetical protein
VASQSMAETDSPPSLFLGLDKCSLGIVNTPHTSQL